MKRFAIIMALMLVQTQVTAMAATTNNNYNKQPAQKTQNVNTKQQQQAKQTKPANNDEYLLKYNINDLEAAPWLNGGKRKI